MKNIMFFVDKEKVKIYNVCVTRSSLDLTDKKVTREEMRMADQINNVGKIIHFEYEKNGMPTERYFQLMHEQDELPRKRDIGNLTIEAVIPETLTWRTLKHVKAEEKENIGPFETTILGIYSEAELIEMEAAKIQALYQKASWDVTREQVVETLSNHGQYTIAKP